MSIFKASVTIDSVGTSYTGNTAITVPARGYVLAVTAVKNSGTGATLGACVSEVSGSTAANDLVFEKSVATPPWRGAASSGWGNAYLVEPDDASNRLGKLYVSGIANTGSDTNMTINVFIEDMT